MVDETRDVSGFSPMYDVQPPYKYFCCNCNPSLPHKRYKKNCFLSRKFPVFHSVECSKMYTVKVQQPNLSYGVTSPEITADSMLK